MKKWSNLRIPPAVLERAVRMVSEAASEYIFKISCDAKRASNENLPGCLPGSLPTAVLKYSMPSCLTELSTNDAFRPKTSPGG